MQWKNELFDIDIVVKTTLISKDIGHHSGQNLTTLMTNIIVDKSRYRPS